MQFSELPYGHRLGSDSERYADRDVWGEFLLEVFFPRHNSYQTQQEARRTGRKWRAVMDDNWRHHVLACPADIDQFYAQIIEEVNPLTAYKTYWGSSNNSSTGSADMPSILSRPSSRIRPWERIRGCSHRHPTDSLLRHHGDPIMSGTNIDIGKLGSVVLAALLVLVVILVIGGLWALLGRFQ